MAGERVLTQHLLHLGLEPFEPAPHVFAAQGKVDAQPSGWCEHYSSSSAASLASVSGAIVSATRSTRPLRHASSIMGTAPPRTDGGAGHSRHRRCILNQPHRCKSHSCVDPSGVADARHCPLSKLPSPLEQQASAHSMPVRHRGQGRAGPADLLTSASFCSDNHLRRQRTTLITSKQVAPSGNALTPTL